MKHIMKIVAIIILLLISVAGAGASYYWYNRYQTVVTNPQAGSTEEIQTIVKKLSAFMDLPNETPSIVTVTDREKLQNQEFFKKAANGDKIIIYEASRRVILYRPSTNRVIDVAPLVFNDATQNSQQLMPQTNPTPLVEADLPSTGSADGITTPTGEYNKFMPTP